MCYLFIVMLATVYVSNINSVQGNKLKRVCYYTNWSQYRKGDGKFLPENIDEHLCTHLIYAFAKLDGNQLKAQEWNDESTRWSKGLYERFNSLKKKNSKLRTLLAVGGWNAGSGPFSRMVATDRSRREFVQSTIRYLRRWDFDGLDIDWEYPTKRGGVIEDRERLTSLLRELRNAFKKESNETGNEEMLLTIAVPADKQKIDAGFHVPSVAKYTDFVNVMTYDLHGAWDDYTGHNSPLYRGNYEDPGSLLNVNWVANYWKEKGIPPDRLIIGFPLYGRGFKLQDKSKIIPGSPASGGSDKGLYTNEAGYLSYYEICTILQNGGVPKWIEDQKVPYMIHNGQWIGYDDMRSFREKALWLKRNKYGGAMVWALPLDDFSGKFCNEGVKFPLLRSLVTELSIEDYQAVNTTVYPTTENPVKSMTTNTEGSMYNKGNSNGDNENKQHEQTLSGNSTQIQIFANVSVKQSVRNMSGISEQYKNAHNFTVIQASQFILNNSEQNQIANNNGLVQSAKNISEIAGLLENISNNSTDSLNQPKSFENITATFMRKQSRQNNRASIDDLKGNSSRSNESTEDTSITGSKVLFRKRSLLQMPDTRTGGGGGRGLGGVMNSLMNMLSGFSRNLRPRTNRVRSRIPSSQNRNQPSAQGNANRVQNQIPNIVPTTVPSVIATQPIDIPLDQQQDMVPVRIGPGGRVSSQPLSNTRQNQRQRNIQAGRRMSRIPSSFENNNGRSRGSQVTRQRSHVRQRNRALPQSPSIRGRSQTRQRTGMQSGTRSQIRNQIRNQAIRQRTSGTSRQRGRVQNIQETTGQNSRRQNLIQTSQNQLTGIASDNGNLNRVIQRRPTQDISSQNQSPVLVNKDQSQRFQSHDGQQRLSVPQQFQNIQQRIDLPQESQNAQQSIPVSQKSPNFEQRTSISQQSQNEQRRVSVPQQSQNSQGMTSIQLQSQNDQRRIPTPQQFQTVQSKIPISQKSLITQQRMTDLQQSQNNQQTIFVPQQSQNIQQGISIPQQSQNTQQRLVRPLQSPNPITSQLIETSQDQALNTQQSLNIQQRTPVSQLSQNIQPTISIPQQSQNIQQRLVPRQQSQNLIIAPLTENTRDQSLNNQQSLNTKQMTSVSQLPQNIQPTISIPQPSQNTQQRQPSNPIMSQLIETTRDQNQGTFVTKSVDSMLSQRKMQQPTAITNSVASRNTQPNRVLNTVGRQTGLQPVELHIVQANPNSQISNNASVKNKESVSPANAQLSQIQESVRQQLRGKLPSPLQTFKQESVMNKNPNTNGNMKNNFLEKTGLIRQPVLQTNNLQSLQGPFNMPTPASSKFQNNNVQNRLSSQLRDSALKQPQDQGFVPNINPMILQALTQQSGFNGNQFLSSQSQESARKQNLSQIVTQNINPLLLQAVSQQLSSTNNAENPPLQIPDSSLGQRPSQVSPQSMNSLILRMLTQQSSGLNSNDVLPLQSPQSILEQSQIQNLQSGFDPLLFQIFSQKFGLGANYRLPSQVRNTERERGESRDLQQDMNSFLAQAFLEQMGLNGNVATPLAIPTSTLEQRQDQSLPQNIDPLLLHVIMKQFVVNDNIASQGNADKNLSLKPSFHKSTENIKKKLGIQNSRTGDKPGLLMQQVPQQIQTALNQLQSQGLLQNLNVSMLLALNQQNSLNGSSALLNNGINSIPNTISLSGQTTQPQVKDNILNSRDVVKEKTTDKTILSNVPATIESLNFQLQQQLLSQLLREAVPSFSGNSGNLPSKSGDSPKFQSLDKDTLLSMEPLNSILKKSKPLPSLSETLGLSFVESKPPEKIKMQEKQRRVQLDGRDFNTLRDRAMSRVVRNNGNPPMTIFTNSESLTPLLSNRNVSVLVIPLESLDNRIQNILNAVNKSQTLSNTHRNMVNPGPVINLVVQSAPVSPEMNPAITKRPIIKVKTPAIQSINKPKAVLQSNKAIQSPSQISPNSKFDPDRQNPSPVYQQKIPNNSTVVLNSFPRNIDSPVKKDSRNAEVLWKWTV